MASPIGDTQDILAAAFPGRAACYFAPMVIGSTTADANEGAAAVIAGVKTATSSGHWHYPDGRIPFVGALSVPLDGQARAVAIVETQRVEIIPFDAIDADFAHAYGEGARTLDWFRAEMGQWYRTSAAEHGVGFSNETPIICEWIAVPRRF
jgi:uncharacterized protein YhfF